MNSTAEPRLTALTIGPELPELPFPVEIHSVFRSAVNLQPLAGGNLVTLLSREGQDLPQSIRLTGVLDFTTLGLEPKGTGRVEAEGISLDLLGGTFRVSFEGARRLEPEPLPRLGKLGTPWQDGVALLAMMQDQAGVELRIRALLGEKLPQGTLPARLTAAAQELGLAVRAASPELARGAVAGLVGLGGGLTPTGDDFLCGFLAAGHCRAGEAQAGFFRGLKRDVLARLPDTNAISGTYLRCAAAGRFCMPLHELAEALRAEVPSREAVLDLCSIGHASGMDLATGFLYGLTIWECP